jgi:hypothetical protein
MKKHQREAILISFLNEKEKYKRLAQYIARLIKGDPSFCRLTMASSYQMVWI